MGRVRVERHLFLFKYRFADNSHSSPSSVRGKVGELSSGFSMLPGRAHEFIHR